MGYNNLQNYYKTLWLMTFHHKYSIADMEELAPYERDIIVEMTSQYISDQENMIKQQASIS